MQRTRKRVDVNLEELDQLIDRSMRTPLNQWEGQKLKTALHVMAERLSWKRWTEKTSAVVNQPAIGAPAEERNTGEPAPSGHGRHGAAAFTGANRVSIAHATLTPAAGAPKSTRSSASRSGPRVCGGSNDRLANHYKNHYSAAGAELR